GPKRSRALRFHFPFHRQSTPLRRHNCKRRQHQKISSARPHRCAVVLSRSLNHCKAENFIKVEKTREPTTRLASMLVFLELGDSELQSTRVSKELLSHFAKPLAIRASAQGFEAFDQPVNRVNKRSIRRAIAR